MIAGPLLTALREMYPTSVVGLLYHPDADPGDGSGWSLEFDGEFIFGSLEQIATKAADLYLDREEVPDAD